MAFRYFIRLAYNGKNYHGWQVQDNAITVQEVLQDCMSKILDSETKVVGCGRTDTGVHATDYIAHFDSETEIEDPEDLAFRLNRFVPRDIAIKAIFAVDAELHARFDATARTYHYKISTVKDPFRLDSHWSIDKPLNVEAMNQAAAALLQYNDFEAFCKAHSDVKTFLCNLSAARWDIIETELIFTITANRFLRNMVRAIVGTLVDVGRGKLSVQEVHEIVQSKDRSAAGTSAPAQGLYLAKIEYPIELQLQNQWRA